MLLAGCTLASSSQPELLALPDLASCPDLGGVLLVSSVVPSGAVDLTQEGAADWVHWGYFDERSVDRKHTTPLIGATALGSQLHQYTETSVTYSWSDGAPTGELGGTRTGVFTLGQGNGFQITAPAGRARRALRVYLSGFGADFRVTARLSDGSACEFAETILHDGVNQSLFRRYTIDYSAASDGQTLEVTWTDQRDLFGGGNVTLEAATLQ